MPPEHPLSHSHLPIRHLVRQLEKSRAERDQRGATAPETKSIPNWVNAFVDELAELFEPFQGVARVGYEACQSDDAWEIAMFLGEKELVGGAADGRMVPVNFRFDIKGISNCFTQVTGVFWNAFPNSHVCFDGAADLSFLTVDGLVNGNAIRLQLHATPPDCVGPAMREHIDGRLELV